MPEDVKPAAEPSAAAAQPIHYDSWDAKGNPIVSKPTPKSEEAAASAPPATQADSEPKGETAAEPEAATTDPQEKPRQRKPGDKLSAGEEISKLRRELRDATERAERLERERSRPPEPKPASAEAKTAQPPQTYAEWRKQFKATPWMEQFSKENPDANYDDALAACADFQAEMRDRYKQYEQAQASAMQQTKTMLEKTMERYPDAKEKLTQTLSDLREAPPILHAFLDGSDVTSDLLYALSDPDTLKNLLATAKANPGKALRVLRDMEVEIEKEISKAPVAAEAEKKPVENKPRAPEPPAVVGGKGTAAEDAAVAAARAGDFRSFEAEQNRRLRASQK